ncbi:Na+/H+ antiporter NhaC family protein [Capnocytophaga granulosa]|uniref:Na+/H+ antiporter NhaC family protein n=1 Tax=Capnocytophaga granulosa TaxID=45242 RepID=UPI0028E305A1|nr:Na+/H+ antiporter NhaC family protein [Capnocytophaga granulosa]
MSLEPKKANGIALLPLIIFVAIFLWSGVQYGSFYEFPAPIAVLIGIVTAFFIFHRNGINENVNGFIRGCGNPSILMMCLIALFSGAFSVVTKSIGATDTFVEITKNYLSLQYLYAGVFVIASFLSFASGTSVGAVVSLAPIAAGFVSLPNVNVELIAGSLLGGAMFGDNLSFISDTTIAATQSQGCEMKDKFRMNGKIALPASVLTVLTLIIIGVSIHPSGHSLSQGDAPIQWVNLLPYITVIVLAIAGLNVYVTFLIGTLISGLLGFWYGSFDLLGYCKTVFDGFASMNDIFLVFLFTGGLAYLIEREGGISFLTQKIGKFINTKGRAFFGIGFLVALIDAAVANNTVAIVISAPVAKKISEEYKISPIQTASILDISSCVVQGIIPYGAQVLLLIKLLGTDVNYSSMIAQSFYIWLLLLCMIVFFVNKRK